MNRFHKDNRGFSTVEVLLIIVTLALVGTAGFFVAKHIDTKKTTPITPTTNKTTSAQPSNLSVPAVTQLLTTFYKQYSTVNLATAPSGTSAAIVKKYGTANLIAYLTPKPGYSYSEDAILCAQAQPTSISVNDVTSTATSASGTITEVFGSDSTKVIVTVVNQSGSLLIDSVTCNPPLVASPGGP